MLLTEPRSDELLSLVDHALARQSPRQKRAWFFLVAIAFHAALLILLGTSIRNISFDLKPARTQAIRVTLEARQPEIPPRALPTQEALVIGTSTSTSTKRRTAQAPGGVQHGFFTVKTPAPEVDTASGSRTASPSTANTAAFESPPSAIAGEMDIEHLKQQAVKIARNQAVTGEMSVDRLGRPLTAMEKFREDVKKSERPDCRTRYAGLGPLAIPFLVENTVTGTGCKW